MACKRKAGTTEHLLFDVIGQLSPIDIMDATNKSADNFYKCSNPNNDQKLHYDDAVSLDEKLLEVGKEAVFLPHFEASLKDIGGISCPKDRFMNLSKEVGELADALRGDADKDAILKEAYDVLRVMKHLIGDIENDKFKVGGTT